MENIAATVSPAELATFADIFAFLALLMRYPEKSFFDNEFLDTLENLLGRLDLEHFQHKITKWRASINDPLLDVQVEYTRLFINDAPNLVAPPYGSVYLESDGTLQGKTTEATRAFYRQYGFDITNISEPADHISLELEFVSRLYRQGDAEAAETFLSTLFLPWFTRFMEKLTPELRHPFFTVTMQLISLFIKEEQ